MSGQSAITNFDFESKASDRIRHMRERYQTGPNFISVERARYYTESWIETENKNIPLPVRVSMAMKRVYEKMTHYIDNDDRIAGYWTEHFLGIPVDVERGVFNSVLASEIDKTEMLKFRAKSLAKGLVYMARNGKLREFARNQKIARTSGKSALNMELKTMAERKINPYQIEPRDKAELLDRLLPFWKGKSVTDVLETRLADSGLLSRDMHNFVVAIPGNTSRQVFMLSMCATIGSYQGHVILDYEKVVKIGLAGHLAEIEQRLKSKDLDATGRSSLESMKIALEGVGIFAKRLAEKVREKAASVPAKDKPAFARMADALDNVPMAPAKSFFEAIQSMWIVKTAVELAHPVNLHCFGRLDKILFPYYKADIDSGAITRDDAREIVEELLLKIMSQNIRPESNMLANFYHRYLGSSPVTLGGVDENGLEVTNDLSFLFVEASHHAKPITNVSVRVSKHTPTELLEYIAEALARGASNFSVFNDELGVESMIRRGFSEADSRDFAVMGCVELTCPGKTGSMSANALLMSKLLDVTLRNGDTKTLAGSFKKEGIETGDPDKFVSFDQLLEAVIAQGRHAIKKIVEGSNLRDKLYAERLPAPLISAFMDGCIEKAKDATAGGGRYDLSGISMINSIANMTDGLYAIKKLVFERKMLTIKEYLEAVDANFVGHERLLKEIRKLEGKWGNGDPESDAIANKITSALFTDAVRYKNPKGGPFVVYSISMTTHTIDGRLSIASPDGRRAATPYAASMNPANVEHNGVTAALRSVASLPLVDTLGSAVNMKFHPSAVGLSAEARRKWASLIRTYFRLGGAQLQPTVASTEMLIDAQRDPESHRDLIVKVGGYSTYFVELGPEIQNEIISRTGHGV